MARKKRDRIKLSLTKPRCYELSLVLRRLRPFHRLRRAKLQVRDDLVGEVRARNPVVGYVALGMASALFLATDANNYIAIRAEMKI